MDDVILFAFASCEAEASEPELFDALSSSLGTRTGMLGEWLKLRFFILLWRKCASFDAAPLESWKRERVGSIQSFLVASNDENASWLDTIQEIG